MATGGIDSTVLLYDLVKKGGKPQILTIDYGHSTFWIQWELLKFHANHLKLNPPISIPIVYHPWQTREGLFTRGYSPNEKDPLGDWDSLRYADFFVEGRNSIMVLYAMAYCSAHGIDELLAGYLYGREEWENRRSYKLMTGDNSPQFVDAINILSQLGFSHQVRFRAPFYEQRMDKADIIQRGKELGVDFGKTYSCYFDPECGKCDNCLLRKKYLNNEIN
jgi:7-cyano-7-deazaguanine synthase